MYDEDIYLINKYINKYEKEEKKIHEHYLRQLMVKGKLGGKAKLEETLQRKLGTKPVTNGSLYLFVLQKIVTVANFYWKLAIPKELFFNSLWNDWKSYERTTKLFKIVVAGLTENKSKSNHYAIYWRAGRGGGYHAFASCFFHSRSSSHAYSFAILFGKTYSCVHGLTYLTIILLS